MYVMLFSEDADMTAANINVRTDGELKARAQGVLNRLGMDMSTAINIYLVQIVEKGGIPMDLTVKKQRPPQLGGWEGKIWMSDDFDAPMEEFRDYVQ
jgi:addiction module RelB/DinJ family antitoxin